MTKQAIASVHSPGCFTGCTATTATRSTDGTATMLTAFFGGGPTGDDPSPTWPKQTTMKSQNYLDLVQKLVVDEPRPEGNQEELFRELKANPEYLSYQSKEKSFRSYLKRKLPRQSPSSELIKNIKEIITQTEMQSL